MCWLYPEVPGIFIKNIRHTGVAALQHHFQFKSIQDALEAQISLFNDTFRLQWFGFKSWIKWSESELMSSKPPKITDDGSHCNEIGILQINYSETSSTSFTRWTWINAAVGRGCKPTRRIKSHWCFMHFPESQKKNVMTIEMWGDSN